MECLVLVNAVCTPPGWIEWGYQKMNVRHLKTSGMTQGVMDYLMWHHFGKVSPRNGKRHLWERRRFPSGAVGNRQGAIRVAGLAPFSSTV